jgi:hypothetical protein
LIKKVKKIVGAEMPQQKGGSGERKLTYGVIGTDRNASGNPKVL